MIGFRDRFHEGPHTVNLAPQPLVFGYDGVLWNPTRAQIEAMTSSATRVARFEQVEKQEEPLTDGAEPAVSTPPQPRPSRRRRPNSPTEETAAAADSAVITELPSLPEVGAE